MSNEPVFSINGQDIPWWFWGVVCKRCGGDRYAAARVFYRAKQAKPASVLKWVMAGLVRDEDGERYAFLPCAAESDNPMDVRAWIDREIFKVRPGVESMGSALRDTLRGMLDAAEG